MFQYAAMAEKVPVTLREGNVTDDFLINQDLLGIQFDNIEDVEREIDRLMRDEQYAKDQGKKVKNSVIREKTFDKEIECLLNGEQGHYPVSYKHIDTTDFQKTYIENMEKTKINEILVRKGNTILFKYDPYKFIGGVREDKEKNQENDYEVSVVVLTYNPVWEKLVATLKSIITQKNVSVQLVLSDDGSVENYFQKTREYLDNNGFYNYVMIANEKNEGTVVNTLHGVEAATGEFIKTISPGDCLTNDYVLVSWIKAMIADNVRWSFSDAIYYKSENENFSIVQDKAHPADICPYVRGKNEKCRWNYVVLDDIALGAAIMAKKQVMVKYLSRIVGKVKYAEDNIWRLMMFDGVVGGYYPYPAVFYETGSGVSTSGSDVWKKRLEEDWNEATKEMLSKGVKNDIFQKDALHALKNLKSPNRLKHVLVKGKIGMHLYRKLFWRKTPLELGLDSKTNSIKAQMEGDKNAGN